MVIHMNVGLTDNSFNIENLISDTVNQNKKIIIYGAGVIGKIVKHHIKKIDDNIEIFCFLITDKSNAADFIDDIPVYEIKDVKEYFADSIVYIAISSIFHDEIIKLLEDYNFKNYIKINLFEFYKQMKSEEYLEELKIWFKVKVGRELNINNPITINEKIQWLKLFDQREIKTILSDKYLVKNWVADKIGKEYVVPLLGVWDKSEDIDFNCLPDKFVIKANNGWSQNIIVKNKDSILSSKNEIIEKTGDWLKLNYAFNNGFELQYLNIEPKIFAEQFLEQLAGDFVDYKFLCFNGEPKIVFVDHASKTKNHTRNVLTVDWDSLPFEIELKKLNIEIKRPKNFDKMIEIAKILSRDFYFVRVDLYNIDGKIYFGEMTFTPTSGYHICDLESDTFLGQFLKLPID